MASPLGSPGLVYGRGRVCLSPRKQPGKGSILEVITFSELGYLVERVHSFIWGDENNISSFSSTKFQKALNYNIIIIIKQNIYNDTLMIYWVYI